MSGTPTPPNPLSLSNEERYNQFLICKQRGHIAGTKPGYVHAIYVQDPIHWEFCAHCGTTFGTKITRTLHERNAPTPPNRTDVRNTLNALDEATEWG